jgi:hypothetical protein
VLNAGVLTFQEFLLHEPLPLTTLHEAVLEFLRDRDDAVVFGAYAVNAYVLEPRMTQGIDLLSTHAEPLAGALRNHLSERFHIAVRVRDLGSGRGFRLFQVRKEGNRHLVDIRPVVALPALRRIAGVQVVAPEDLIAMKVIAYYRRRGQPKSGTDWRDLALLLLAFPDLKRGEGPVADRLHTAGADAGAFETWQMLVEQVIEAADDEDGY